jgi:hypothetical protein
VGKGGKAKGGEKGLGLRVGKRGRIKGGKRGRVNGREKGEG